MARSEPTLFLSWSQAVSNNLKWRISERIPLTHLSKNKQRLQTIKEWPRIKPLSVLIVKKKKKDQTSSSKNLSFLCSAGTEEL